MLINPESGLEAAQTHHAVVLRKLQYLSQTYFLQAPFFFALFKSWVPLFSSGESEFYLKFQMVDCPQLSVYSLSFFFFFPFYLDLAVLTSLPYFAFLWSFKNQWSIIYK